VTVAAWFSLSENIDPPALATLALAAATFAALWFSRKQTHELIEAGHRPVLVRNSGCSVFRGLNAYPPPAWVRGAGGGAGGAVAAVAVHAARALLAPSFQRVREHSARKARWVVYLLTGAAGAALLGPYLVLVLVGCGLVELAVQQRPWNMPALDLIPLVTLAHRIGSSGGAAALAFTGARLIASSSTPGQSRSTPSITPANALLAFAGVVVANIRFSAPRAEPVARASPHPLLP